MKSKLRHLVRVVDNASPKIKIFKTKKAVKTYLEIFEKYCKSNGGAQNGYWVDLVITDITGAICDYGEYL